MDKIFKYISKRTQGILSVVMIIMSIILLIILGSSFHSMIDTNNNINKKMQLIHNNLLNKELKLSDSLKIEYMKNIEKIDFSCRGTIDANTISFLFQIFAVILLTSTIFLLSSAFKVYKKQKKDAEKKMLKINKEMNDIKKEFEDTKSILSDNIDLVEMTMKEKNKNFEYLSKQMKFDHYLTQAYIQSFLLTILTVNQKEQYTIVPLRDNVKNAEHVLISIKDRREMLSIDYMLSEYETKIRGIQKFIILSKHKNILGISNKLENILKLLKKM